MKLRTKGNSLRLRVTRSEIAQLTAAGALRSETDFGDQVFCFGVDVRDDVSTLSSTCGRNAITVTVPKTLVAHWAATEEVGIYGEQATSNSGTLTIALEKDFRCLDPGRDEDESDHFENPLAGVSRHLQCDVAL